MAKGKHEDLRGVAERAAAEGVAPDDTVTDEDTGQAPGTDLAPVDAGQPFDPARSRELVADGRPVERKHDMGLTRALDDEEFYDEEAAAAVSYRGIIDQILRSESIEEILTPPDAVSARDVLGEPLILYGFHINRSEYEVGSPHYFSMSVKRVDTDERLVVNCGNQRVMAQLLALHLRDIKSDVRTMEELQQVRLAPTIDFSTPVEVFIRQAKRPNRHGSYPVSLDSRPPAEWR